MPDAFKRDPALNRHRSYLLAEVDKILAARPMREDAAGRAFTRARMLLDANQWPEATRAFGEIAFAYPREDLGIKSVLFYHQGLNMLGNLTPSGSACFDELSDGIPTLQRLYCDNGDNRRHPQECYQLYRFEREFERGVGCKLREPSSEPREVSYAQLGAKYSAMALRCLDFTLAAGVSPIRDGRRAGGAVSGRGETNPSSPTNEGALLAWAIDEDGCDDFAFYAALAFLKVPDRAQAEAVRALLLDPKNGMQKSPRVEELEKLF